MSQRYRDVLDHEIGARIIVEFTTDGRKIVDYAVVLTVDAAEGEATVRVYDGTIAAARRHPRWCSMQVLLGKECGPRSPQFASTTRR